jgi:hypothetical protein
VLAREDFYDAARLAAVFTGYNYHPVILSYVYLYVHNSSVRGSGGQQI